MEIETTPQMGVGMVFFYLVGPGVKLKAFPSIALLAHPLFLAESLLQMGFCFSKCKLCLSKRIFFTAAPVSSSQVAALSLEHTEAGRLLVCAASLPVDHSNSAAQWPPPAPGVLVLAPGRHGDSSAAAP